MPTRFPRPWGNHYNANSGIILILFNIIMNTKFKTLFNKHWGKTLAGMDNIIPRTSTTHWGVAELPKLDLADEKLWPLPKNPADWPFPEPNKDWSVEALSNGDFKVVSNTEIKKFDSFLPDPPSVFSDLPTGTHPLRRETDPNGIPQNAPGAKVDAGKSRVWLCLGGFSRALDRVAEITTVGANKYTPNGWMTVPNAKERYMDAFGRHMLALGKGEVYDNGPGGTGGKHIAQMAWNLLAVLELEEREEESKK